MSRWIALVVLGGFISLAAFAYGRIQPLHYVTIWKTKKAEIIADIYDISPEETERPIRIFGE